MEKPTQVHSYCINGTSINLSCDNLLTKTEHKKNYDIIVVGEHEQRFLQGYRADQYPIGKISYLSHKNIFIKSETLKAYLHHCQPSLGALINQPFAGYKNYDIFKLCEPAYKINVDSTVIEVIEPKLLQACSEYKCKQLLSDEINTVTVSNYVYPKVVYKNNSPMLCHYFDKEAVEKSLEDLSLCYKNVLEEAYTLFTAEHQEKSIVLPFLSSILGIDKDAAAKVAATSLINFLMNDNNKNKYGLIKIELDREEDIVLFKKYLQID